MNKHKNNVVCKNKSKKPVKSKKTVKSKNPVKSKKKNSSGLTRWFDEKFGLIV